MTRRQLGWGLVVYGVVGIVLVIATAAFGLGAAGRIDELVAGAERTLDAAAESTGAAAEAVSGLDASLSETLGSARAAAELARDASLTLDALGRAMQVSIFGAQPLLPLADDFATSATQASALGDTLDRVGDSLQGTAPDVSRIGLELEGLATELRGMRAAMGDRGDGSPIIAFVVLLLAWLLVPAVGGLLAGLALIGLIRPLRLPA